MGLIDFNKLPVNTLVGADWKTFKRITAGRTVESGYKTKYVLTQGGVPPDVFICLDARQPLRQVASRQTA